MVVQMERGMPRRGKREVCPIRASYPKGLGEFTPLACRGVQRGNPSGKPGRQRSAKLVWRSRAQPWQDIPGACSWYILFTRRSGSDAAAG